LDQRLAGDIVDSRDFGCSDIAHPVDSAAGRVDPSAGNSLAQDLLGNIQGDDEIEMVIRAEVPVQEGALRLPPGEPVDAPSLVGQRPELVHEDPHHPLVIEHPAGLEHVPEEGAQLGAVVLPFPEQVTGAYQGDVVEVACQPSGDCSLPASLTIILNGQSDQLDYWRADDG
jgi:hypothetical protein